MSRLTEVKNKNMNPSEILAKRYPKGIRQAKDTRNNEALNLSLLSGGPIVSGCQV